MDKLWELLVNVITGRRSRIFWAVVIVLVVFVVIVYPYIDANFLYYDRIEKRIDNLQKLVELTGTPLEENEELNKEYLSIVAEMETAREKALSNATNDQDSKRDKLIKFASGAGLWVIVAIGVLFPKKKNEKVTIKRVCNNLLSAAVCLGIGSLMGCIFTYIPTLGSVDINAAFAPTVQLIVIWLIMDTPNKKKVKSTLDA